jgi:choline-phosphate cytidylyltransferase
MTPHPTPTRTRDATLTAYLAKSRAPRQKPSGRRVITYGTYDLLHDDHLHQLGRARALGDYLIVAVLTDIFDAGRGKRFLAQDVVQRVEGIKATGLADEVVLEECDDKINNILKYDIDIVAVFDAWEGPQAYVENLRRYCEVVFMSEQASRISSTTLRGIVQMGITAPKPLVQELLAGAAVTSGVSIVSTHITLVDDSSDDPTKAGDNTQAAGLHGHAEAVFLATGVGETMYSLHEALLSGKHVLCQAPLSLTREGAENAFKLAEERGVVLVESLQSAFTPAMERMTAIAQNGKIGRVISVDVSLNVGLSPTESHLGWQNYLFGLGEALAPIVRILHGHTVHDVSSQFIRSGTSEGICKVTVNFGQATATVTIGYGLIMPEALVIIGTEGYLTMPTPWREASSFHLQFKDVNFEEASDRQDFHFATRRGGYRYDLAEFASVIKLGRRQSHMLTIENSVQIADIVERALAACSWIGRDLVQEARL